MDFQLSKYLKDSPSLDLWNLLVVGGQILSEKDLEALKIIKYRSKDAKEELLKKFFTDNTTKEEGKVIIPDFEKQENLKKIIIERLIEKLHEQKEKEIKQSCSEEYHINLELDKTIAETISHLKKEALRKKEIKEDGNIQSYVNKFFDKLLRIYLDDQDQECSKLSQLQKKITKNTLSNKPFVSLYPQFSEDIKIRGILESIIKSSKTFQSIRLYGGDDITHFDKKFKIKLLQNLEFPEEINEAIFKEIVKNPLSLVVSNSSDLTNFQKHKFFSSDFYENSVKEFSIILSYSKSKEFKVYEDIERIVNFISKLQIPITNQIIDCLFAFDIYSLLKIKKLDYVKVAIYNFIEESCKDYHNAVLEVKHLQAKPESFRNDEEITLKLEMRMVFLEIELNYEKWQEVQNELLAQNYEIVDKIALTFENKFKFRIFILQKVKTYFRRKKSPFRLAHQLQKALTSKLLNSKIGQYKFEEQLVIIQRTILDHHCKNQYAKKKLRPEQYTEFLGLLDELVEYRRYRQDNWKDIENEDYIQSRKIERIIYEINFKAKTDSSWLSIESYIQKCIKSSKILTDYHKYICDLTQLQREMLNIPVVEEIFEQPGIMGREEEVEVNYEELNEQKAVMIAQFNKELNEQFSTSKMTNIRNSKFKGLQSNFAEIILSEKLFDPNFNSQQNNLSAMNVNVLKKEIQDSPYKEFVSKHAFKYVELSRKIENSKKKNEIPHEDPSAQDRINILQRKEEIIKNFYNQYTNNSKETVLEAIVVSKYNRECGQICELILSENPLENQKCRLYDKLTPPQKKKLAQEIKSSPYRQLTEKSIGEYEKIVQQLKGL